jgi:hypothetical protein
MLPRRRKRERMGVRVRNILRLPGHLKWVRGHECLCIKAGNCSGRMEAHHDRHGWFDGKEKPPDNRTVPLCAGHHGEGDRIGWWTWERQYGVNVAAAWADLWKASPHRITWERKNEEAIL